MRRWLAPFLILGLLAAAPRVMPRLVTMCCTTSGVTVTDSVKVWTTTGIDSATLSPTGMVKVWPGTRVDSTYDLRCEEYVVTLDKHTVTLVATDSPNDTVTASVTHCGGVEAPNVKMTWTSRNTDTFTVQSTTAKKAGLTAVAAGHAYLHATSDGGGADSALVTVTAPGGCVGGPTSMCPGDDVAAKVAAAAAGATITFADGTYRMQSLTPKTNMTFRGDPASPGDVVLTGARVLCAAGWQVSGTWWACGGQTQNNTDHDTRTCASGHPGCNLPEQLWVEDSLYERMTTKAAVTDNTQKWFFDLATDSIYINRDPTGLDIETSVTPQAFSGTANGITIKGLTIKRYATGIGNGTIEVNDNFLVDSTVIRENNGTCIRIDGDNSVIRYSTTSRCGMQGMGGPGSTNLLVYRNVIDSNNTALFGAGGGDAAYSGLKISHAVDAIVRRNTVRGNNAIGLWCDIDCEDMIIDSNTVTGNVRRGIQYEISWGCDISYNTVTGNNTGTETGASAAGIWISTSTDCDVHHNTLSGNLVQVMASDVDRGTGLFGTFKLTGLRARNNTITHNSAGDARAAGIQDQSSSRDPTSVASDNDYLNNTYTCDAGTRWLKGASQRTKAQWTGTDAQDPGSTFSGC